MHAPHFPRRRRQSCTGCRLALGLLVARCDDDQILDALAILEYLAERSWSDRDAHRAAVDELRICIQALEPDDE